MWRALQRYKELGFELSWGSLGWELLPLAVPSVSPCTQIVAISVFIIKNLCCASAKSSSGTLSATSASLLCPGHPFGAVGQVSVPSWSRLPLWRLCWSWQQPGPAGNILEGYSRSQSSCNLPRGKFLSRAWLAPHKAINKMRCKGHSSNAASTHRI